MKKKRTKAYRPKPQLPNPLAFVLEGLHPVVAHSDDLLNLKLKNHAAMLALTQGRATRETITTLVGVSNMCAAFVRLGFGEEHADIAGDGQAALLSVARRNKFTLTATEMQQINDLMELHDAQMDVIQIHDLDRALAIVHKDMQTKKAIKVWSEAK